MTLLVLLLTHHLALRELFLEVVGFLLDAASLLLGLILAHGGLQRASGG